MSGTRLPSFEFEKQPSSPLTPRRKILHVVDLPVPNPWLNGVARHHDRDRYEHLVVSLGPRCELHAELERHGLRSFALEATTRADYPKTVLRLVRLLRTEGIDIVQTHLFDPSVLGLVAGAVARTTSKIVTRHHSDFTTTFNRPWHRRLDRLQAMYADRVMAASAAVKRDMLQYERVADRKVTVARYGYDFDVLRPSLDAAARRALREDLCGDADRPLLLTVSRLSTSKGHRYLIDGMPRILQAAPNALFLWAGTGPLEDELRSELESRRLVDHVKFLGWRSDVPHLMESADVIIHASLHEAFCSVIIEAMALARPLVATNVAAAPEQIDDGETGLLVPGRDGVALAEATVRFLEDPEFAARTAAEAQVRVRERFNFPKMMRLYESIYEDLLPC